ncbi:MAG: glucosaminidase domain-containing protein [Parafilimonas sp.]|nr:glucosaminidase domain-containing protein [Parafilimonas sp.]
MKKLFVFLFAAAIASSAKAQNNEAVNAYIEQYKQLAIDEMIRTGVPASITLAQGILESNAGQCTLTQQSNNHFGIKCKDDWTGSVVYHDDDRKHECFRRYNSAEDSYRDHSDFLKNRPNYAFLFNVDATDYTDWAYGLKKAGYATNPAYASLLINTIEKYDLEQYTDVALQQSGQMSVASSNVQPQQNIEFTNAVQVQSNQQSFAQQTKLVTYPNGVFRINQCNVLYAQAGTSLFALATQYDIPYKKLLEFNDLDNVDILQEPMLVYLEKKQKSGTKDYHVVVPNENLHDIAQEEGVQIKSLIAYNNFQQSNQPKPGDKILLYKK